LGTFLNAEGSTKSGIWEEGSRVQWLEESEQKKITSGLFDFRILFKLDKNKEREISNPLEFGFEQPKYLEHKIEAMLKQFSTGSEAHRGKKK